LVEVVCWRARRESNRWWGDQGGREEGRLKKKPGAGRRSSPEAGVEGFGPETLLLRSMAG
jgi:hypothetical protein